MKLTPKQLEALNHAAHGLHMKQVADRMGISMSTVDKHLAAARHRLHAKTLANAVYKAVKGGFLCLLIINSTLSDDDVIRRSPRRSRREQYEFLYQVNNV